MRIAAASVVGVHAGLRPEVRAAGNGNAVFDARLPDGEAIFAVRGECTDLDPGAEHHRRATERVVRALKIIGVERDGGDRVDGGGSKVAERSEHRDAPRTDGNGGHSSVGAVARPGPRSARPIAATMRGGRSCPVYSRAISNFLSRGY